MPLVSIRYGTPRTVVGVEDMPFTEIKLGDIVRAHGMRVRIDLITAFDSHGSNRDEYPTTWSCVGTVVNAAEVLAADPGMRGYLA